MENNNIKIVSKIITCLDLLEGEEVYFLEGLQFKFIFSKCLEFTATFNETQNRYDEIKKILDGEKCNINFGLSDHYTIISNGKNVNFCVDGEDGNININISLEMCYHAFENILKELKEFFD
jgi:hypothetical protein